MTMDLQTATSFASSFRLNLRVMPDPKMYINSSSSLSADPHDELETQNSAENLRRNMHKVMSSRQRQLENDRPASCPGGAAAVEPVSGSDADSQRSSESSQNPNPTLKAFHERQTSAPADPSMPGYVRARPADPTRAQPPALPPKNAQSSGSACSLTGSGTLTLTGEPATSNRMRSIVPVPGPIPQPAIAGSSDKLSPRVFAGFNLGLGAPKKNSLPVSIPSVPSSSKPFVDDDGFLRPRTPVGPRPPIPDRKPIKSRMTPHTPVAAVSRQSYLERPKSTPPSLHPSMQNQNAPGGEDTEYDSDPGNLSSMSATMTLEATLGVGGANVSNLSVTGLGDQWAMPGDQWAKPMAQIETPKDKRRFSEGFFLFHKVQ